MSKETVKKIPSVLSFSATIAPSYGLMYGTVWEKRQNKEYATPLKLQEKTVRGVIGNRDPKDKDICNANPQTIDSCSLNVGQDTLIVKYTVKFTPNFLKPECCSDLDFLSQLMNIVDSFRKNDGCKELAKRYATNILNRRTLWRNSIADEIEVEIGTNISKEKIISNAYDLNRRDFNKNSPALDTLTKMLSDFFIGKNGSQYLMLDVNIYAKIGCGQTVYPSQEFVGGSKSKDKDSKGKVLYSVNDVAALHSQKIGNAIRTIDTWYPECDELDIGPISVESYGSMTTISKAFRDPESKKDFFTLFDKFALGQKIETEDELYVMAMLIRGGLFGKKKKGEE